MELRPLYLAAGRQWRVTHEERALRVDGEGRAPAWYPFRRLGRVVSAMDVDWRSEALVACLRAGVPVCFVDGHGKPQGYCYGSARRETTLDGLLAFALESAEWELRYSTWHGGMHRQLLMRAQHAIGVPLRRLDRDHAEGRFCNAHYRNLQQPVAPLLRAMDGAMHAQIAARLARSIGPQWLGHPRPGLNLVNDFATLLHWSAHAAIAHADTESLRLHGAERTAAYLLEQNRQISDDLEELLHGFELWLGNWVL